jgi:CDP-paratose 2-epimerase
MNILITGGAGFIGCHLARRFGLAGHAITVYDNLSRHGSESNLEWLQQSLPAERLRFVHGDVRDAERIADVTRGHQAVFHLAGQVAVTTSVINPREDFEINAWGTFNVLEAARLSGDNPVFIYSSTNKVYGGLDDTPVVEGESRYAFAHLPHGVPETQPLDFHSPYGNSKGSGDQYARDYARIYHLPTVVFRQSAIYGPRQFGVEDQGWLAFFAISAALGRPITIYGDGKQVRDLLYIDDLARAFELAVERIDRVAGRVYNIGGGPAYTLSIWAEAGPLLEQVSGRQLAVGYAGWRPGDQRIYVSDIRQAERELGWRPLVAPAEGLAQMWAWIAENRNLFE